MNNQDFNNFIDLLKGYNESPEDVEMGDPFKVPTRFLIRFLEKMKKSQGLQACMNWLSEMKNLETKPKNPKIMYKSPRSEAKAEIDRLVGITDNYKLGSKIKKKDIGWSNDDRKSFAKIDELIDSNNIEQLAKVEFWELKDELSVVLTNLGLINKPSSKIGRPKDETASDNDIEEAVREIIKEKSFLRNGKPKPTRIRDYLLDPFHTKFNELPFSDELKKKHLNAKGELADTQTFERVKTALENIRK